MTWFKVTAHSLPKDTLWVNYGPDSGKGKEGMLRTRNLGRTDGQTDGMTERQTDHYRAPAERIPNKIVSDLKLIFVYYKGIHRTE